jgi:8-oxo-dGTP diphosphatase
MDVTAAILLRDGLVMLARRGPGEKHAGGWEFPGGKIEQGETPEQCLERELREEFGWSAVIGRFFMESTYEYKDGMIRLLAYLAAPGPEEPLLRVHDAVAWASPDELAQFGLLPADVPIAHRLRILHESGAI